VKPESAKLRWIYVLVHAVVFLLGVILMRLDSLAYQAVGSSLVAAGIAGWVILAYVAMTQRVSERVALLEDSGLLRVFPARSIAIRGEYEQRVAKAKERIDIIGFGLRALREDFRLDGLRRWASAVEVRILLIDPDFPSIGTHVADLRDQEEGQPTGTIATEVHTFVRECASLIRDSGLRFHVRLYGVLPAVNYFRVDDEAFWGPYLMRQPSRSSPTLLVKRGSPLFEKLAEHFEAIWSRDEFSRQVPGQWFQE
jgi:hypothetical protein